MKTQLTKEQSQHLIDLGVPKEKASKLYWKELTDHHGRRIEFYYSFNEGITDKPFALQRVGLTTFEKQDIFTLEDLLNGEILPKEIEVNGEIADLCFDWNSETKRWGAGYAWLTEENAALEKELIDALYELACWYYGEFKK